MKNNLFLFFALLWSISLQGQFDKNPLKQFLNFQTDSKGLVHYGSGVPTHIPQDRFDTYNYVDTVGGTFYSYNWNQDHWEPVGIHYASTPPDDIPAGGGDPAVVFHRALWYNTVDSTFYNKVDGSWIKIASGAITPPDTARTVVYKPAHNWNQDTLDAYGGFIPVKADWTKANASTIEELQVAYVVHIPHQDSIEIKTSGVHALTGHPFATQKLYFLTDAGTYDTIPGTVRSEAFLVIDDNTVDLAEKGGAVAPTTNRLRIAGVFINAYGGDPQAPHDTIIQKIAEDYASIGKAVPGTILYTTSNTVSDNPTYQETELDISITPSHAWLWNGAYVTRLKELLFSVNLQDSAFGFNLALTPISPAGSSPTDQEVADWLETNHTNNGFQPVNGTILYFKGNGTEQNPDYAWMVIDDISGNIQGSTQWTRLIKRIKEPVAALTAENVSYDNTSSGLNANSVQDAIDEGLINDLGDFATVSPKGDNNNAELGRLDKAFADPWTVADSMLTDSTRTIIFYEGEYEFTGPYGSGYNDTTQNLANKVKNLNMTALGPVKLNWTNVPNRDIPVTDYYDNTFGPTTPKDIVIDMPSSTFTATNADDIFNFVRVLDLNSTLFIRLKEASMTGGRVFGIIGSGKDNFVEIDRLFLGSNTLAVGALSTAADSSGSNTTDVITRRSIHRYGTIEVNSGNDILGVARIQNSSLDSASFVDMRIGEIIAPVGANPIMFESPESKDSYFRVDLDRYKGGLTQPNSSYDVNASNDGAMALNKMCPQGCYNIINFGDMEYENGPMLAAFAEDGSQIRFDSTTIEINIDKLVVKNGVGLNIRRFNLKNGSKIIINCQDCVAEGDAFISIDNNSIETSTGSAIILKGNYRTIHPGSQVLNVRTPSGVYLEGNFTNDGTVAAIQSDSLVTISVQGAFNTNSILNDPNVTIQRLNEYGAPYIDSLTLAGGILGVSISGDNKAQTTIDLGGLVKTGTASPYGSTTPDFVGQYFIDTANDQFYVAQGATNNDWVQPSSYKSVKSITGNTSYVEGDQVIIANPSSNNIDYTLPPSPRDGIELEFIVVFVEGSGNTFTIDSGSDTINGAIDYSGLDTDYESIRLFSWNSNWFILR